MTFFTPLGVPPTYPQNLGLGADIKNRLDEPKSMPLESMHAKNEIPTIIRIGYRGGLVRKSSLSSSKMKILVMLNRLYTLV